jgi:tripartite-type tricarboxylate transporter receptor subunit TctC
MKKHRCFIMLFVYTAILLGFLGEACAQEKYPTRPIEVVTTFPPGGTSELFVRTWGKYIEKSLGQPVVILAKPGGGGVIGFTYTSNARPDGYTLLNAGDVFPPILEGNATYKLEDLRIVAQNTRNGSTMVVAADAPWKTWQEFVDYAKKNPGVKYSHPGKSTMSYFRTENLNRQLGMKMVNLPSAGDAESIARLLGKHVPIACMSEAAAIPQLEAGKLRALLSFDPAKDHGLPASIPDVASLYGKDFPDIQIPVMVFVPAKTPEHIVQSLEKAFEKLSTNKDYIADLKKIGKFPFFVPGKIATEQARKRMELMRAILADQQKAK